LNETRNFRLVCKDWNSWITEFKAFWPFRGKRNTLSLFILVRFEKDYDKYINTVQNIQKGIYKTTDFKLEIEISEIITTFSFGIVAVGMQGIGARLGFNIYSKTTFQVLYRSVEPIVDLKASKHVLVVKTTKDEFHLLSFKHSSPPKESLVLTSKELLPSSHSETTYTKMSTYVLVDYPLITFGNLGYVPSLFCLTT